MMTEFEHIKSLDKEGLIDFLSSFSNYEDSPWEKWFSDSFCKNCDSIECTYGAENTLGTKRKIHCAYCELENKCKFFTNFSNVPTTKDVISLWLDRPYVNNKRGD